MKTLLSRPLPLLAAAALLLVLSPATVIYAQPPGGGPGGPGGMGAGPDGPGFMLPRIARALDLSDAQIEQAKTLLQTLGDTVKPLREQGRALHEEIDTLLSSANPNATAIGQKVIEGHALREQGRAAWEDFQTSFEALLTPAQKEKWELLQDVRRFLGGRHDGPRGGMGPGGPGA